MKKNIINKNISMLLILVLILQMGLPILTVSADEGASDATSSTVTQPYEGVDDEDSTTVEEDADDEVVNDNDSIVEEDPTNATTEEIDNDEEIDDSYEATDEFQDDAPMQIGELFPDGALANVIATELGLNVNSYILPVDLNAVAVLHATDAGIGSIAGIQYLRNLEVLRLTNNGITNLSPLAGLTNLYQLELANNTISDISPLAGLINLSQLSLSGNQIRDLRPLSNVYLYIQDLDAQHQSITLPTVKFGEGTHFESFLPDGTLLEKFHSGNDLHYKEGAIIWHLSGMNQTTFSVANPFPFSVTVHQEVVERDIAPSAPDVDVPRLSQISIDLMYTFIANNSQDNPFTVPTGVTFDEAINALDWGEDVTVQTSMSGLQASSGMISGGLSLQLNAQIDEDDTYISDDSYWFVEVELYIQLAYVDLQSENPTTNSSRTPSFMPQMGSAAANTMLAGSGVLIVGGIVVYWKTRKHRQN